MGLTEEYRDELEGVEKSLDRQVTGESFLDLKSALDNVLPFILLLLGFVILFTFFVPVTARVEKWIVWGNWIVISYFAVRLVVEFKLSNSDQEFVRQHWLDMLIVIPVFSIFEEVKMMQVVRESEFLPVSREVMTGSATVESTGIAARLTKISRIIRKSLPW